MYSWRVPLTAAGELKIQAVADLGGLGAKEGAPVTYQWVLPNLIQPLLAWMMILGLLLLKPNRCGSAWWILAPMAVIAGGAQTLLSLTGAASSESEMLIEVINGGAFGLAAVWLLAPFLTRKHRFLTLLCFLPTLAVFTAITVALRQDWTSGESLTFAIVGVFLGLGVLVMGLALFLTGLVCRRRYRPLALSLWLLVMLAGIWFLIATPIFAIGTLASGGAAPWREFCGGLLMISGVSFVVVLPFMLLSFANELFRERLKRLLHLEQAAPPPPPAPPLPESSPGG